MTTINDLLVSSEESPADQLAKQPKFIQEQVLSRLSKEQLRELPYDWNFFARPKQRTPPGLWDIHLILAGRGFGKGYPLYTPIVTPVGWTTMGELKAGDEVFDEAGNPCKVTFVTETYLPDKAYKLRFSDGTELITCGEHQWVTWTHAERKAYLRSPYENNSKFPENWPQWRLTRLVGLAPPSPEFILHLEELKNSGISQVRIAAQLGLNEATVGKYLKGINTIRLPKVYPDSPGPKIRTTQDIFETLTYGKRGDRNHCIPQCAPLNLPEEFLVIDPYVLGFWLGDGSKNDGVVAQHPDDMDFLSKEFEKAGHEVNKASQPFVYRIPGLRKSLGSLGVLNNKHIPQHYLRSSAGQRLALLQGLMDTDGTAGKNGHCEFTQSDERLAKQVYELIVSLGMRASITSRMPRNSTTRIYGKDNWRITFIPTMQVFRLPRKAERLNFGTEQSLRRYHRMIVSCEPVEPVPMRCITVDSPNSMYLAGEAMIPTHNTRTGAQWVNEKATQFPGCEIAIVGPTTGDTRRNMIEGGSGVKGTSHPKNKAVYHPAKAIVKWENGTIGHLFSADEPDRIRGANLAFAWLDELASWRYDRDAWDMLQFALRTGTNPQTVITTTPRPTKLIRELMKDSISREDWERNPQKSAGRTVIVTRGSTYENRSNLAPSFFNTIIDQYENSSLGRQEIYAEIIEDVAGALWKREWFQWVKRREIPDMKRVVVAIDPAVTSHKKSNKTGICVAGKGVDNNYYVLHLRGYQVTPKSWAEEVVRLFNKFDANKVVAEVNNGGEMVEATLRQVNSDLPVKTIHASKGKRTRAENISTLYEQGRVCHVGSFPEAEEQMCMFTGDPTNNKEEDDLVDAVTWALTELSDNLIRPGQPARAGGFHRDIRVNLI